jgi:hypothetical protein
MSEDQAPYGVRPHTPGGVRFRQILRVTARNTVSLGLDVLKLQNRVKALEDQLKAMLKPGVN